MQEFTLKLPCGVLISSKLKEEDVSGVYDKNKRDMKNGYVWYYLPGTEIGGESVVFSLCFHKGIIESFNADIKSPELYGASWNDWSEEKEIDRAKDTQIWLRSVGCKIGKYPWGKVWAGYDSKGGSSKAGVRYAIK